MNNQPVVSVIIPTYNRAHLVGRAIDSVLAQTFQDFELLVVDDCSTDNTEEVVADFGDHRIRYLRHEVNKGAPAARNTGIRASQGEYIAFLDSDDEWLPEKLERQIEVFKTNPHHLEHLGVVLTGGYWTKEPSSKAVARTILPHRGYVYPYLFSGGLSGYHTLLVRRPCLLEVGLYDETLPASQHWDLLVRLSAKYDFDVIERCLAVAHRQSGPHIRTRENISKAYRILLQKYAAEFVHYPKCRDRLHDYVITTHIRCGAKRAARCEAFSALRLTPFRWKVYSYLLLSLTDARVYRLLAATRMSLIQLMTRSAPDSAVAQS